MSNPAAISPAARQELDRVAKLFEVTDSDLLRITHGFLDAYRQGLQTPQLPVTMAPSWVTHQADGTEIGTFLVLDVGWDSFYVAAIQLDGNRSFKPTSRVFDIGQEAMKAEATVFFDTLAKGIATFLKENSMPQDSSLNLGFTFPFAMEKESIDRALITSLSKSYDIKNAVGKDVCILLQEALDRASLNVKCVAVVNDTVAGALSESYLETSCLISAIYGVGTNGCYVESGSALTKLSSFTGDKMLVNTEWGAFQEVSVLKPNEYDAKIDNESTNPGHYIYQKMMAWFYVGEIARFILLDFVDRGLLFNGISSETLKQARQFHAFTLFQIEDVDLVSEGLSAIKEIIAETLGCDPDSLADSDAEITRRICSIVAARGGKLSACPLAAVIVHLGYVPLGGAPSGSTDHDAIPVAVAGELFLGSKQFEFRLKQAIGILVGKDVQNRLQFHQVKQGGVVGAAIAAYDAVVHHGHGHNHEA